MNKPSSSRCNFAAVVMLAALPLSAQDAPTGSLWRQETSNSMFSDKKARSVGDILTIVVQESATASRQNDTKTGRSSSVDASISSFLFSPTASGALTKKGTLPAMKFSGKNDFEGSGQINNSETITTRIPVRVMDVLPNGNLVVEGRRKTSFSGEQQEAILRGVVRGDDITASNTIFSYNVADATIMFTGKGTVTDVQKKGWFGRFWDKVSPF